MKKYLLLILIFSFLGNTLSAQLTSGTTMPKNVTGVDYNTGDSIDVQQWLDEGKTVVLDLFAVWCPPCWTFHQSDWLSNIDELYGPEGTDQIRVLAVEGDDSTLPDWLVAGGDNSFGDWTTNFNTGEKLKYNLIDNDDAARDLSLAYWPTLYIFKPDGTLIEVGAVPGGRYDMDFWLSALGVNPDPNIRIDGSLPNEVTCFEVEIPASTVDIYNISQLSPLTDATFNLLVNGEVDQTITYNGPEIAPFNIGQLNLPAMTFDQSAELTLEVATLNGEDATVERVVSGSIEKFELTTRKATVLFTTDFYPGETSWTLEDDNGTFIIGDAYDAGPGNAGSGGADAYMTFEYEIDVPEDASCLHFRVADSYGDGMTWWSPGTNEPPGVEVKDALGNFVKDNVVTFDSDGNWTNITGEGFFAFNSTTTEVASAVSTSVPELEAIESSSIYPNPVIDQITLELSFVETVDYSINITNTMGQTVRALGQFSNSNLSEKYNVTDLSTGIYFVVIQSEQGQKVLKFNKI